MKDKNVAGILALFLGWLGIHRFYLGQTGLGIFYLIFCWFLPVMFIIGLIDAISLLSMDKENFDFKYNRHHFDFDRRDTDFERRNYRRHDKWDSREERRNYRRETRRTERKEYKAPVQKRKRNNPYKASGIKKYKEFDYDEAIADFEKALELDAKDVAVHFNLACAYSLNEKANKSFYHLDKAVEFGFNDFKKIKEHDALAFLRIQDQFEDFEKNGFRLVQKLEAPQEDLLNTDVNLLDQLKKLGELREKGLLTEDEFAIQKKKLLG